jgi:biotin carboxylase
MFDKILIANRGEIACRVIDTCRRLGVATVAVYSEADRAARHVAMADEAVHIGGPKPADSYLRGAAIIDAARAAGAQAIHPGYGFLSENPDFVEAVAVAGLVFIGPSAAAIRAMGLKDAAKALMPRRACRSCRAITARTRSRSICRVRRTPSATPCSSRPWPVAAARGCARSPRRPISWTRWRAPGGRPRRPSATTRFS